MSIFKVLGGIAIGVGAVAAAPFTGGGSVLGAATLLGSLTGAGAIASAVGAGTVGAAAGVALSVKEKNDQTSKEQHARNEGVKAGELLASQKYEARLKKADSDLQRIRAQANLLQEGTAEYNKFCKQIVAMFGVGLAVAYCDGHLAPEEQEELVNILAGKSAASYPAEITNAIELLEKNPPSFEKAVREAENAGVPQAVIDGIIIATVYADNVTAPQEQALISQWERMSYSVQ